VKDDDKPALVDVARRLRALGFTLCATGGTAAYLARKNIKAERVNKVLEGGPHIVDRIVNGEIALVINTTAGKKAIADSYSIRRESLMRGVAHFTTMEAARMVVAALEAQAKGPLEYRPIQEWLKPPVLPRVERS
jgi:carbamoyl-phosphate synthase large subunit